MVHDKTMNFSLKYNLPLLKTKKLPPNEEIDKEVNDKPNVTLFQKPNQRFTHHNCFYHKIYFPFDKSTSLTVEHDTLQNNLIHAFQKLSLWIFHSDYDELVSIQMKWSDCEVLNLPKFYLEQLCLFYNVSINFGNYCVIPLQHLLVLDEFLPNFKIKIDLYFKKRATTKQIFITFYAATLTSFDKEHLFSQKDISIYRYIYVEHQTDYEALLKSFQLFANSILAFEKINFDDSKESCVDTLQLNYLTFSDEQTYWYYQENKYNSEGFNKPKTHYCFYLTTSLQVNRTRPIQMGLFYLYNKNIYCQPYKALESLQFLFQLVDVLHIKLIHNVSFQKELYFKKEYLWYLWYL